MTVEELIERLKQFDPKLPVTVAEYSDCLDVVEAYALEPDGVRLDSRGYWKEPLDDATVRRKCEPHVRIG